MLLDASVAESMERVQGCVQVHLPQPHLEPRVEFVTLDDLETPVSVRSLEDRSVAVTFVLSVDIDEPEDRLDWTEQRIRSCSERDLMYALAKLVILRLGNRNHNTVVYVVTQRLHVLPAQDHLEIDGLERLRDEIATPQHGEEIEEAQVTVNLDCLLKCVSKM